MSMGSKYNVDARRLFLLELLSLGSSSTTCVVGRDKVAACAKHFVGDGGTTDGINENNTVIDWKGLLRIHMPAYYNSIIKGVATVMVSHSSLNGKKMHANHELVTGFLKNTLKFRVINIFIHFLSKQSVRPSINYSLYFVLNKCCRASLSRIGRAYLTSPCKLYILRTSWG